MELFINAAADLGSLMSPGKYITIVKYTVKTLKAMKPKMRYEIGADLSLNPQEMDWLLDFLDKHVTHMGNAVAGAAVLWRFMTRRNERKIRSDIRKLAADNARRERERLQHVERVKALKAERRAAEKAVKAKEKEVAQPPKHRSAFHKKVASAATAAKAGVARVAAPIVRGAKAAYKGARAVVNGTRAVVRGVKSGIETVHGVAAETGAIAKDVWETTASRKEIVLFLLSVAAAAGHQGINAMPYIAKALR